MGTELNFSPRAVSMPALLDGMLVSANDLFTPTVDQRFEIGTKYCTGHRTFRYAKNAAVALTRALMTQTKVIDTHYDSEVQTGATLPTAGDRALTVIVATGGLAAAVDNMFAGGTLTISYTASGVAPLGDIYRIATSTQLTETTVRLELTTPIRTAWLATAKITLLPNPWYNVVVYPTTGTGMATGVPLADVAASYYFWAQTEGDAPIVVDTADTVLIGQPVGAPNSAAVAGACGPLWYDGSQAGVASLYGSTWGICRYVAAAADTAIVDLRID